MKKMNTKKYKYSIRMSETKTVFGHTLHRIVALRRVGGFFGVPVNPGDDGGWIENESCLSQDGECWVFAATDPAQTGAAGPRRPGRPRYRAG